MDPASTPIQGRRASARLALLFMALSLVATACKTAAYREPITRFEQASTVVIEGARTTYAQANRAERDAEIDRLVSRRERISLRNLNAEELRLLGPDDITARMQALNALAKHGELLLVLASRDAPQRAKDAANSLDDAVVSLTTTLGNTPSDAFSERAGALATIAGGVAKLALAAKIRGALDEAITASETEVHALLRLLRLELGALYERRRSIASRRRVAAVDAYNELIEQPNPSARALEDAIAQIKAAEDAWDDLPLLLGAGPSLDAMARTHSKLVEYARSSKTPQDLAGLVEAIDSFVTQARVISDAITTLREAQDR